MTLTEIETMAGRLLEVEAKVKDLATNSIPAKPWYTRAEVFKLRPGISKETARRCPWLLPNKGQARRMNERQTGFTFIDVREWLLKDADQLEKEWREAESRRFDNDLDD